MYVIATESQVSRALFTPRLYDMRTADDEAHIIFSRHAGRARQQKFLSVNKLLATEVSFHFRRDKCYRGMLA